MGRGGTGRHAVTVVNEGRRRGVCRTVLGIETKEGAEERIAVGVGVDVPEPRSVIRPRRFGNVQVWVQRIQSVRSVIDEVAPRGPRVRYVAAHVGGIGRDVAERAGGTRDRSVRVRYGRQFWTLKLKLARHTCCTRMRRMRRATKKILEQPMQ